MLSELIVCSRILGSTHAEALDKVRPARRRLAPMLTTN